MPETFEPDLLRGISVYQDVVLAGQTIAAGRRDCHRRWSAIEPYLPAAGPVLDVGSNFGWFGLQITAARPKCVVASVEADERSAEVQRRVLASHCNRRVCLLTARADERMLGRFAAVGQRFEAALCLSVLHWMPAHRPFVRRLGAMCGMLFVEQPDWREEGAGIARVRREIGPIGPYLAGLFPDRIVAQLDRFPSYRDARRCRELWMVGAPRCWPDVASAGLEAEALLRLSPGWPERNWWEGELARLPLGRAALLTAEGIRADGRRPADVELSRLVRRIPDNAALSPTARRWRRSRRALGDLVRRTLGRA